MLHTVSHKVSYVSSHKVSHIVSNVASRTVSQVASQPERIVQLVDVGKAVTSTGGGMAYATKSWKDATVKVDVVGYVTNMELKNFELVSICFTIKSQSL